MFRGKLLRYLPADRYTADFPKPLKNKYMIDFNEKPVVSQKVGYWRTNDNNKN